MTWRRMVTWTTAIGALIATVVAGSVAAQSGHMTGTPEGHQHGSMMATPGTDGSMTGSTGKTFFAAVAVRTRSREIMLPLLVLPLLLPLVILAVRATGAILDGADLSAVGPPLTYLMAFDVIYCTAGWLFFEFVVRE